jgi:hypothetical protein
VMDCRLTNPRRGINDMGFAHAQGLGQEAGHGTGNRHFATVFRISHFAFHRDAHGLEARCRGHDIRILLCCVRVSPLALPVAGCGEGIASVFSPAMSVACRLSPIADGLVAGVWWLPRS